MHLAINVFTGFVARTIFPKHNSIIESPFSSKNSNISPCLTNKSLHLSPSEQGLLSSHSDWPMPPKTHWDTCTLSVCCCSCLLRMHRIPPSTCLLGTGLQVTESSLPSKNTGFIFLNMLSFFFLYAGISQYSFLSLWLHESSFLNGLTLFSLKSIYLL